MKSKSILLAGLMMATLTSFADEKIKVAIDTSGNPYPLGRGRNIELSSTQKMLVDKGYEVVELSQSPDFIFNYSQRVTGPLLSPECTVFAGLSDLKRERYSSSSGTVRLKNNKSNEWERNLIEACEKAIVEADMKVDSEKTLKQMLATMSSGSIRLAILPNDKGYGDGAYMTAYEKHDLAKEKGYTIVDRSDSPDYLLERYIQLESDWSSCKSTVNLIDPQSGKTVFSAKKTKFRVPFRTYAHSLELCLKAEDKTMGKLPSANDLKK